MDTDDTDDLTTVHLVLPRDLRRAVKRLAAEHDSTIREITRRALIEYLARRSETRS